MAKNVVIKITQKGAKKTGAALKKVGGAVTFLGKASAVSGAGIAALSTKLAGDFQKSLLEISTLMDDMPVEVLNIKLRKMSNELRSVSASSGLALDSLSKARYDIVSAGFSEAADSAAVLDASARLAVGGVTSAAEAADLLTTSLNALGLDADNVNQVSNELFMTVKLGKTTMTELAASMGQVLPFAKGMGMDLKGVGASMATLTASGISTAQATTSLRSAMQALQSPTETSKTLMQDMGIEIKRFDDGTVDLVSTVEQFKGIDPGTMRKLIPSVEGILAIQTMAQNFTTLQTNVDKFANKSAGASEIAFKKMTNSFNTQMSMLKNHMANIMITIGDIIIDSISPKVKEANSMLQQLGDIGWEHIGATVSENIGSIMSMVNVMATSIMNIFDAHMAVLGLKIKKTIKELIPGSNLFGTIDDMNAQIKILTESAAFATEANMDIMKNAFNSTFTFVKERAQESADAQAEADQKILDSNIQLNEGLRGNRESDLENFTEIETQRAEVERDLLTTRELAQKQYFNKVAEQVKELKLLGVDHTKAEQHGTKLRTQFMSQEIGAKANQASSFLALATQASAQNKSAAMRTKMLAKGEAIVKTFEAANKTFAQFGGYPIGIIPAALAVAVGMANVRAIDAQQFASGGIVQGVNTGQGDTVPAMLTPGELILNQAQQNNLAGGMGLTINFNGAITNDEYVKDFIIPEIEKTISQNLA